MAWLNIRQKCMSLWCILSPYLRHFNDKQCVCVCVCDCVCHNKNAHKFNPFLTRTELLMQLISLKAAHIWVKCNTAYHIVSYRIKYHVLVNNNGNQCKAHTLWIWVYQQNTAFCQQNAPKFHKLRPKCAISVQSDNWFNISRL